MIKTKILNVLAKHPKVVTLGVSLGIAAIITAGIAVAADLSHFGQLAYAGGGFWGSQTGSTCSTCGGGYWGSIVG
jgi:hypothetical protein